MAMIIRGGTVVDTDPVRIRAADVLIDGGRIVDIVERGSVDALTWAESARGELAGGEPARGGLGEGASGGGGLPGDAPGAAGMRGDGGGGGLAGTDLAGVELSGAGRAGVGMGELGRVGRARAESAGVESAEVGLGGVGLGGVGLGGGKLSGVELGGGGLAGSGLAGVEVVDATGMLVLPGFVDTHRHTWQAGLRAMGPDISLPTYLELVLGTVGPRYRPDDVHIGTLVGALECLDAGITAVVDWNHIQHTPDHTAAAIDALQKAGIRAVFGYCVRNPDCTEARRVLHGIGGLLTMAMAPFGPEITDEETALREWRVARELDLAVTVHMGAHGEESASRGLDFLQRNGLLGPRTSYAHGNDYTDEHLKIIAGSGGVIAVSPVVEMELGLGAPVTARARAAGVPTGLGADTVISGPGDMFSLMRADYANARLGSAFTTRDALRAATVDGARVAGLDNVGTLTPGSHADLVLLRTDLPCVAPAHDPVAAVVLSMDTRAVDTVIVSGRIVKRNGQLLTGNLKRLLSELRDSAARVTATA
jgi:cytosine/adenosine deaminase-related metal-dependent hydrolase